MIFQALVDTRRKRFSGHMQGFVAVVIGLTLLFHSQPLLNMCFSNKSQTKAPHGTQYTDIGMAQASRVSIEAIDWLYVRYGPGLAYPRIGTISKGTHYPVLRRNAQSTWLEIGYPMLVGERGWIFRGGVTIDGNLDETPVTSATDFGYPTLTPTPVRVVTSVPPWTVTPAIALQNRLKPLSDEIYRYLVGKGFEPGTEKVGSVFLMDLQTGEPYSINPGFAYSGMSLIKLPILVAFYRKIAAIPTLSQAQMLGLMIVCSENASADQLLTFLGDGDAVRGAAYVTETVGAIGLKDTFLAGPLVVMTASNAPSPTPPPIVSRQTSADQVATRPDPFNQTTPADLGWLLAAIYQCALDGTGPLPSVFPGALDTQKCRAILRTLRADDIPAMLRAGVPDGIPVAHKHGWVDEVHGDAGIVFTPGGDYVLVIMLRNRTWLDYTESFPAIAEISRRVYNVFNPADTVAQMHTQPIPSCSLGSIDPQLFPDLRAGALPPIR